MSIFGSSRGPAAVLLALWTGLAAAADWPISEQTLDNGLKVVVREDHRAPVVVSQVWYRVGSSYEHAGITGISHVLEHMMFKGTKRHPAGEFSDIIARQGGSQNAFTARDYTAYFEQLAADRLETAFELEADRMHNLTLEPGEFRKERQVVIEERRMRVDDRPDARFGERFNVIAHPVSPYGHPIIGWRPDLDALTVDDLRAWYRRWYAPANATLVVVGDVRPEAVFALAKRYFGAVPARDTADPRKPVELPAPGERHITVHEKDARVRQVELGYTVPSAATASDTGEVYALRVLSYVLDGGSGARLEEDLVRGRGIAASAGAGYDAVARLDTLFELQATPAPGHGVDELTQSLRDEVRRLQDHPVDADTLERARNQLLADHQFSMDSVFYQAMQIGMLETTGVGWRELERFEDGVRAVKADDVQAVARRYLIPARLTVGVLEPGEPGVGGEDGQ